MANLLSKAPLLTPDENAEVYVVYDNKDYRMALGTLISLVTKSRLGLENVDNTSDADKPISIATAQALSNKADRGDVVSKSDFDALAATLQNYIGIDQLNAAIANITTVLNRYTDVNKVAQMIAEATEPITSSISQIVATLQSQQLSIQALQLEQANLAIKSEVDTSIANAIEPVSNQVALLNQQITALTTTVSLLNDQLINKVDVGHTHTIDDIYGLRDVINNISVEAGDVTVGPNDW